MSDSHSCKVQFLELQNRILQCSVQTPVPIVVPYVMALICPGWRLLRQRLVVWTRHSWIKTTLLHSLGRTVGSGAICRIITAAWPYHVSFPLCPHYLNCFSNSWVEHAIKMMWEMYTCYTSAVFGVPAYFYLGSDKWDKAGLRPWTLIHNIIINLFYLTASCSRVWQ